MLIVTTPTIPGKEDKTEAIGLVFATSTRASNVLKDSFAGIKDVWGGRSKSYRGVLEGSIEDLYNDISERAASVGADAVVSLQITSAPIGDSKMMAFQAIGTAVRFRP